MIKNDNYFMKEAIKLSKLSLKDGLLPVGAVVVANGKIIGKGRRLRNRHPFLDHAEIMAIRSAIKNKLNCFDMTLYTTLEPCLMCFSNVLNSREIRKIVYSIKDPYGGGTNLKKKSLTPRYREWWPIIKSGVLKEETSKLFRDFFNKTNDSYWKDGKNKLRILVSK